MLVLTAFLLSEFFYFTQNKGEPAVLSPLSPPAPTLDLPLVWVIKTQLLRCICQFVALDLSYKYINAKSCNIFVILSIMVSVREEYTACTTTYEPAALILYQQLTIVKNPYLFDSFCTNSIYFSKFPVSPEQFYFTVRITKQKITN